MATVQDVAREAGVSAGTVSNVLNNRPFVKDKNREAVLRAIDRLGFVSNMAARTLKTKSSGTLGLLLQSITNPYYPDIARGVEDAAEAAGLSVFLCNCDRNARKQRRYVDALLQKNVDGIIMAGALIEEDEIDALSSRCPLVLINGSEADAKRGINVIAADITDGIRQAMDLLLERGIRDIAFLSDDRMIEKDLRYEAYAKCLRDHDLPVRREYSALGQYTMQGGYNAAYRLLKLKEPPKAILAANDLMAAGALRAALDEGKRVPGDIAVIGCDNIELSEIMNPSLTTIDVPRYEMGTDSVKLIMDIQRQKLSGEMRVHPTSLVIRSSVSLPTDS